MAGVPDYLTKHMLSMLNEVNEAHAFSMLNKVITAHAAAPQNGY